MGRRDSSGLTIGQVITLTFGFLLASVIIFVFGLWVGRDLAEQHLVRANNEVIRVRVSPLRPAVTETVVAAATPPPAAALAATPTAHPTETAAVVTATAVRAVRAPTPASQGEPFTTTPTSGVPARARTRQTASVRGWTVQASATNDQVQAVILARKLRSRGYDAYTVQGPIGGVTWFRVRVGRFRDRPSAEAVEGRLRREEGLEAAYVTTLSD